MGVAWPFPLSRKDGPLTSHLAGEEMRKSGKLAGLHLWVVQCVQETPGLTQAELGVQHCPTDPRKIGRRLSECVRLGWLKEGKPRKCTHTGRLAKTWYPLESSDATA